MIDAELTAPSAADIEALAHAALETIPAQLRAQLGGVAIRVEEFPDDDTQKEMELESPFDLLGLYHGVSLREKSAFDVAEDVDMIFLYRRPLLDHWCEGDETLGHLVRHVLIHEIGHHFGFSDDDMEKIEGRALAGRVRSSKRSESVQDFLGRVG